MIKTMLFFYIIYFSKNDFYSCFLLTGNIQRSNQFFYRFKTMPVAIIIHPVNHFYRDRWIHEIIGSYLDVILLGKLYYYRRNTWMLAGRPHHYIPN